MTDQELLELFRTGRLDPGTFAHRDHVRLAFLVLEESTLLEALVLFRVGLKRMTASAGRPEAYHETITWAFLMLVSDRRRQSTTRGSWEEFAAANVDLLSWPNGVLTSLYSRELLDSDEARRVFIAPDQLPAGSSAPRCSG